MENQIRPPKEVVVDLRSEGLTEATQVEICLYVAVSARMCMHRGHVHGRSEMMLLSK